VADQFDLEPKREEEESYENNLMEAREEEYVGNDVKHCPGPLLTDEPSVKIEGEHEHESTSLPLTGNGCSTNENESTGNSLIDH